MKAISVFCGSSAGNDPAYEQQAFSVGKALAERQITTVYGGAKVGLMGAVANGALAAGGKVIGVLPHFLAAKEIAHEQLTELLLVESMHERKLKMCDLCEGAIALPGGFGTLEELFEMLTWGQLGLHQYPIAVLNVNGYYDSLISLLQHMTAQELLRPSNYEMLIVDHSIEGLLQKMSDYIPPSREKWIKKNQT